MNLVSRSVRFPSRSLFALYTYNSCALTSDLTDCLPIPRTIPLV